MFGTAQIIIAVALLGALGTSTGFMLKYRADVKFEQERNQRLQEVADAEKTTREALQRDIARQIQINKDLSIAWKKSEQEKEDIRKSLTQNKRGKDRDIADLAKKHPKLIESAINNGTKFAARCAEILSGSPVRETDKDNNVCPELVKGEKK